MTMHSEIPAWRSHRPELTIRCISHGEKVEDENLALGLFITDCLP